MIKGAIKLVPLLILFASPLLARPWTNTLGRTFEAEFVRMDGTNVIFTLASGRAFSTPLADLSAADQAMLRGGGQSKPAESVPSTFGRPWPREIRLDGPVACKVVSEDRKAGRYIYESPGYRFTCDARVTDDALRNFSVMFEATRKYAQTIPLSLGGGRQRQGKMDILLFGKSIDYIRAGGSPNSSGCYVPSIGVVMVPMESLGLKEGNTGFSLDTKRYNNVLVHELVHQLTPTAYHGSGTLGWFTEGLAEYMAITPYNWGYFQPDIHGNVVKTYVTTRGTAALGGRGLGTTIKAPALKDFLLMPYPVFSGPEGNTHYGIGVLLVHYFVHMEGGGKAFRITQFLKGQQAGQRGEPSLAPLLGGGSFEKLEGEISAAWARMGVNLSFGG